jgi:septin family protein
LQLIQTVVVKQVLTEKSKEQLYEKYQGRILQLKKESDQLLFELKRMEKTKNFSPEALKKKFEIEVQRRKEKIKLLEFQIEQLHNLPLGSELQEREVQALVEVNVGDSWDERLGQSTIIIEDGMIKEIR